MASVFKRNGRRYYYISWSDGAGKRHIKSSRTTDRKIAQQIAVTIERECRSTKLPGAVVLTRGVWTLFYFCSRSRRVNKSILGAGKRMTKANAAKAADAFINSLNNERENNNG